MSLPNDFFVPGEDDVERTDAAQLRSAFRAGRNDPGQGPDQHPADRRSAHLSGQRRRLHQPSVV